MDSRERKRIRSWLRKGIFDALLLAGVKEHQVHYWIKDVDEFSVERQVQHLKMMHITCKELMDLWSQHPKEMWDSLHIRHKAVKFPEIIRLNKLKHEVRRQWNLRPRIN